MNYEFTKEVFLNFEDTINKVKEELAKEDFGILIQIDVKDTLKKKLGVDYENYVILGACNPPFAHKVLQIEKKIGLFLPCNVIVYKDHSKIYVSAINPLMAMPIFENKDL